jgi:RimJ/RimL family protein N-acetyltransferase
MIELRTGDLLLRPPIDDDVPAVTAACQDEDIARFLPLMPRPYRESDARTWLEMTVRGWAGELDEKAFVITRVAPAAGHGAVPAAGHGAAPAAAHGAAPAAGHGAAPAAFLGVVSLRPTVGGLGYWLAREARGAGVMPLAVAAVIEWGRREHGVRVFHLLAHPDNVGSQRVAEKLGFERVGTVAHSPAFSDGTTRAVRFELPG